MPRWVFFFCFFVLEFIRWSSCTWTLALCEGKSLFLAKCSVTNLSDYRMDFLYLGALDSIQGAKGIGFHSVFGHAGHFLFWFFMREECSLLAYLLVGSMPEQEMHSVPPIPTAEQNGFIDPKHNCLPHAKAWVLAKNSIEHGNHAELRKKRPACGGAEANGTFRVQYQRGGSSTEEKLQKSRGSTWVVGWICTE